MLSDTTFETINPKRSITVDHLYFATLNKLAELNPDFGKGDFSVSDITDKTQKMLLHTAIVLNHTVNMFDPEVDPEDRHFDFNDSYAVHDALGGITDDSVEARKFIDSKKEKN